mgnify:FL=1
MATNSILDNLTSKDMISTIKLEIGADVNKEKTFLVVEGKDDKKFLKYLVKDNVVICESYSGKKGIEEILEKFKNNKRIIGIRDRDYEKRKLDNRIFFYDFCNIEMMIINDDDAFEKICCEYYEGEIKYNELRKNILQNLLLISILRKRNEDEKKMWNFNGINYDIDEEGKIVEESLFFHLQRINPSKSKDEFVFSLKRIKKYEELLNITNGHDFTKIFIKYCKKENKKNINENNLLEVFRCAFSKEAFKKTSLYKDIKHYQILNKIQFV